MKIANKTILVTGADGFIGSHLTELLVKEGAKVKALSLYNSFNTWGWLDHVDCLKDIEILTGDVRDQGYVREISKDVAVIFHLAALIAIPYSYKAPESYIDTNIRGTVNLCQAALNNGCERVIHTSTSEVYGTARYVPMDENHPLQPQSPYSASKISADAMAMSFYNALGLPLTIARPFNTYGPRQSARAIIPTIITQMAKKKKEIQVGDLSPTRDLNYVEDTCRGFLALAQCDAALGETVNIGSNHEIRMADLFSLIADIMGSDSKPLTDQARIRPQGSEVFRLWCDNRKLISLTGFAPPHTLRQGLEKTVAWFLNPDNLKRYKADIYNV